MKVGIFNNPKVKKGDNVEFVYGCRSVKDKNYAFKIKAKVEIYQNSDSILVKLPNDYIRIGRVDGWLGKTYEADDLKLEPEALYWWVSTWRLSKKQNLDIE